MPEDEKLSSKYRDQLKELERLIQSACELFTELTELEILAIAIQMDEGSYYVNIFTEDH